MAEGMTQLEKNIQRFEKAKNDIDESVREAHKVLKDLQYERRQIERLLGGEVKTIVHDRVDAVVKRELDVIAPSIKKQTDRIYEKVGEQIDILINICLGKPLADRQGKEDLRPVFAARLRELIQDIIEEEAPSR